MQFIVYSEDREDGLPIREANRSAHLKWLSEDLGANVLVAGPWLDDNGTMRGSMLIVDAVDKVTVEMWLTRDPYAKAGLTETVIIRNYKWVIGAPGS